MTQRKQQPSSVTVSSFALHQQGVTPLGSPSFRDWLACGHFIRNAEQSVQFWIGDWLLYGEKAFGKTDYEVALQETGLSPQTLYIYKYVAAALPLSVRRKNVSFHHHKEVASLAPEIQTYLLDQAEVEGWPLLKLKQEKYRLHLETARTSSVVADSGLHLGDCLNVLATLPDASIDMVLTAPDFETTTLAFIVNFGITWIWLTFGDTSPSADCSGNLHPLQKRFSETFSSLCNIRITKCESEPASFQHLQIFSKWYPTECVMPLITEYEKAALAAPVFECSPYRNDRQLEKRLKNRYTGE